MPRTHLPGNLILSLTSREDSPTGHSTLHFTHPYTGLSATLYRTLYTGLSATLHRSLRTGPSAHRSLGSHVHDDRIRRINRTLRPRYP